MSSIVCRISDDHLARLSTMALARGETVEDLGSIAIWHAAIRLSPEGEVTDAGLGLRPVGARWGDAEWAVEQLSSIGDLLAIGRQHGLVMTATPAGRALLRESAHPDGMWLLANVCPVAGDPWTAVPAARSKSHWLLRLGAWLRGAVIGAGAA